MNATRYKIATLTTLLVFLMLAAAYLAENVFSGNAPQISNEHGAISSLSLFLLINVNIVAIMCLGYLLFRNIVKLFLERRRNILGSKLRTRLVAAFVGLSFFPTLLLFFIAKGLLGSVMQGWFSPQVQSAVDNALNVGYLYYDIAESRFKEQMPAIRDNIYDYANSVNVFGQTNSPKANKLVEQYLEQKRKEHGYSELSIYKVNGESFVRAVDSEILVGQQEVPGPNVAKLSEAIIRGVLVRPENLIDEEIIRAYIPLKKEAKSLIGINLGTTGAVDDYILVATMRVHPKLTEALARLIDSYDDYRETGTFRRPLASSYVLMLIGGTLLIIFLAIWVGFKLAATISEPIRALATGTSEVARGNLSYQLPNMGDDELGTLVHSFNQMTSDLQKTTDELVARRRYMETVLGSIGIGVVSIDLKHRVTTCNSTAARMLRLVAAQAAIGKSAEELLPKDLAARFSENLNEVAESNETVRVNMAVPQKNEMRHIEVTITGLVDDNQNRIGTVILLDDVTELTKAQRMAAWRDVARRIAHEIKNPLTPIQLSAQRIQKRFTLETNGTKGKRVSSTEEEYGILSECTKTIVEQVQVLRNLVNEFSRFARLPKTNISQMHVNELLSGLFQMYQQAHTDIEFKLDIDDQVPVLELDKEQMNRAIVNLLDNAVTAVHLKYGSNRDGGGRIKISSKCDADLGMVTILVSDTGTGISDEEKRQIFEPYFSTKKGGTGLGLAIVSSIVADHNGHVRVHDNDPCGSVFRIELPVNRKVARDNIAK